jgi:hypothetical protein
MSQVMTPTAARLFVLIGLVCLPWSAPSAAAQGRWTGVVTELPNPEVCSGPAIGFDANGDGLAVWSTCDEIRWARYTRTSGSWSQPQAHSAANWAVPTLYVHPGGHAVMSWWVIDDYDYAVGAWASVYDADTGTWTQPVEFSPDGPLIGGVVDSGGSAIVAWVDASALKTATYDSVAGVWNMAADIHVPGALFSTRLRLDANDQAILLGQTADEITRVARFDRTTAAWSDVTALAGQGLPNIVTDTLGNMTVVWARLESGVVRFQASHYRASSGTWSEPAGIAIAAPGARATGGHPALASDSAGNTIAVWEWSDGLRWTIVSATYHASDDSWDAVASATLGPNAKSPGFPNVRLDPFGNATVIWSDSSARSVEAARRGADGSWSLVTLASSGTHSHSLAVDPVGNAAVAWVSESVIHTTRWEAAPPAPTITHVTPSDGTLSVVATTPPAPPWFANTNYEYSLDDGVTWITRSPASTTFPLEIGGLVNGVSHQLRLRGVNSAGAGLPSAAISVASGSLLPPANLTASVVGNTVTLQWTTPPGASVPTGYVLEGGLFPGEVLESVAIPRSTQTFTFTAPTGVFFIRLHSTMNGGARSLASNEIVIRPGPPQAAAFLFVLVVDDSGVCIKDVTVEVVGGQRVGTTMTQSGNCNAWSDAEIEFWGLTPGVAMTLRVSASGYSSQDFTFTPSAGPQTAHLVGRSPR